MSQGVSQTLSLLKNAFEQESIKELKEIGAESASELLIKGIPALLEVSLIAYSLSKFLEKPYITRARKWNGFRKKVLERLEKSVLLMEKNRLRAGHEFLKKIVVEIEGMSFSHGRFVASTVEKARIKAAAQVYAHGASLGKSAELTGASKRELAKYIGITRLHEKYRTMSVRERLDLAEELFE